MARRETDHPPCHFFQELWFHQYQVDLDSLQVYADPLLEKVFYNLADKRNEAREIGNHALVLDAGMPGWHENYLQGRWYRGSPPGETADF